MPTTETAPAAQAVVDLRVKLEASARAVWETLTTPDGLERWFCTEASVSPGLGGRFAIGWSVGDSFEVPITAWEPERHLRLDHPPFQMDFFLKGRNGRTELRLVNPTSAAFYQATRSSWSLCLANLRHYLDRHAGQPGGSREIPLPRPSTAAEGWRRLTGSGGVRIEGDRFSITVGRRRFGGPIDLIDPPRVLGGTLPEWDDTLLRVSLDYSGEPDCAHLVLRGYGDGAARLDELAGALGPWLGRLLGGEVAADPGEREEDCMIDQTRRFEARVAGDGPNGAWARIHLPIDVPTVFGTKSRLSVRGTVNGFPFRSSIFPNGDGTFHMMFNKAMQAGAKAGPGDIVAVAMEPDDAPREVEVPSDLVAALEADEPAAAHWQRFPPSARQMYVEWIVQARAGDTRARRIERAVAQIAEGKKLK